MGMVIMMVGSKSVRRVDLDSTSAPVPQPPPSSSDSFEVLRFIAKHDIHLHSLLFYSLSKGVPTLRKSPLPEIDKRGPDPIPRNTGIFGHEASQRIERAKDPISIAEYNYDLYLRGPQRCYASRSSNHDLLREAADTLTQVTSALLVLASAALGLAVPAHDPQDIQRRTHRDTKWTAYSVGDAGAMGACNFLIHKSAFAVALGPSKWDPSLCGRIISLKSGGKQAFSQVLDKVGIGTLIQATPDAY
ncbi:hypothetical protein NMY22_g756 [Coprinellus aureogranulatus]|nr:hypothetical protein NMY22_g756 [Coprinellus aureogranulatus]